MHADAVALVKLQSEMVITVSVHDLLIAVFVCNNLHTLLQHVLLKNTSFSGIVPLYCYSYPTIAGHK